MAPSHYRESLDLTANLYIGMGSRYLYSDSSIPCWNDGVAETDDVDPPSRRSLSNSAVMHASPSMTGTIGLSPGCEVEASTFHPLAEARAFVMRRSRRSEVSITNSIP